MMSACDAARAPVENATGNAHIVPEPGTVESADAEESAAPEASRTPTAPDPTSAKGAADVVQRYYGLLGERRYAEALPLRADDRLSAQSLAAEVEDFVGFGVDLGAPGRIEGAAGSLYVDVPVRIHGRLKDGTPVDRSGSITLRRSNDIPGSTAEQRRWRIASITFGQETG